MSVYPPVDVVRDAAVRCSQEPHARIAEVAFGTPAYDAGFEPGCALVAVNGQSLRDVIDWRWLTEGEDAIQVEYIDLDGDRGCLELVREPDEAWGFTFEGVVFNGIRLCRNACSFCFMRQLPDGARPSLALRDDDFRLSFLSGTFVTLTNIDECDVDRILEQRISPLRVSLHAVDVDVRRRMIGPHAPHGLSVLDRLLEAGIEVHAQIVLVPGDNDGEALVRTLSWAYERPGVLGVGIVPLGYTRHQSRFSRSYEDPRDALAVLRTIEPFRRRALSERGGPWVFAADELYRNAYGEATVEHLPPASHYGDFCMFEDGIGMIRSYADEFAEACENGLAQLAADCLDTGGFRVRYVVGAAMQPFLDRMIEQSPLAGRIVPMTVQNSYYGGNVDVTGLLCACDIIAAIREAVAGGDGIRLSEPTCLAGEDRRNRSVDVHGSAGCGRRRDDVFVLPAVIFNDDGVTLDDATVADMEKASGVRLTVVSCNPLDYLSEIILLVREGLA